MFVVIGCEVRPNSLYGGCRKFCAEMLLRHSGKATFTSPYNEDIMSVSELLSALRVAAAAL